MKQLVITGALVYTGGRFVQREVYVQEGRIAQLAKKVNAPADCPRLDLSGKRLAPGFIDIHT
ncbi:MAG TPA: dihydropyrimidinase, partial [Candidatus Fournierella merdipullorum]|nr:dihydropyrimidinase [Candidatus Fournierella merdipullorum]